MSGGTNGAPDAAPMPAMVGAVALRPTRIKPFSMRLADAAAYLGHKPSWL